jgi:hypothetical protein
MTAGCVEQDDWSCHGPRAGLGGWRSRAGEGSAVQYETVAEAYRDLERAGGRLALIDRLAALLAATPAGLLPTVCYLCQGLIAPEFAGVDLDLAEKLNVRAVATATGAGPEQVAASVRETGDLGQAAEQLLTVTAAGRPASLQVTGRPEPSRADPAGIKPLPGQQPCRGRSQPSLPVEPDTITGRSAPPSRGEVTIARQPVFGRVRRRSRMTLGHVP